MHWELPEGCEGLIFDCDGTLVDSMPLHYESWIAVLKRHGLVFPEEQFYQWAGQPVEEIVRRLSLEQRLEIDATLVAQERDAYFHASCATSLRPVKAVVDIARRYRGRLPLAVGTGSTRESAEESLRAIGILDWFDAIVSSKDAGRPKPAPDVFLRAAECIQRAPAQCAVFEDSELGLIAAREAGMVAVDIRKWLQR